LRAVISDKRLGEWLEEAIEEKAAVEEAKIEKDLLAQVFGGMN